MSAELKNAISITGNEARYDACAKRLLSQKIVLAHILVKVVEEFREMKPQDVISCIEGEPLVSIVPVDPGITNGRNEIQKDAGNIEGGHQEGNADLAGERVISEIGSKGGRRIVGFNTENKELHEGVIFFDIIFYVRIKNGISKIIINMEMQKDEPTKYYILNRIIFYVSRIISSQKERDFVHSNYNDMKEVYSIWICTGEKENTLNYVRLSDEKLIGSKKWNGNLNLFNAVIVGLSDNIPEYDETYDLHRLLGALLSETLSESEKLDIVEKEYGLSVEAEKEVTEMCNLGQGIRERAEREGREKGREQSVRLISANLLKAGMPINQIAQIVEVNVEKLQGWFQEAGLTTAK